MKQKTKQLIMTLALLITAATGAWATDPTVYESGQTVNKNDLKVGDIILGGVTINGTDDGGYFTLIAGRYSTDGDNSFNTDVNIYPITVNADGSWKHPIGPWVFAPIDASGQAGNAWEVTAKTENGSDYDVSVVGIQYGSTATTVPLTWDATAQTATIAKMPAGNVTVNVEYFDFATITGSEVTKTADVAAKTETPLVTFEGTITGGTLMYAIGTETTYPDLDGNDWSADIPTAENFDGQGGTAYVWYYIKGDDEHSDTDPVLLAVKVLPEPTYNVEFAEGTDPNEWSAEPAANVKKGQTVKVTYTGSKKVIGVKAEKKAKAPATVLGGALVDGATIKVNFKWRMENSGDYVQGVYNAASGTFTASKGGYDWNDDERAVYKVEKSGDNIIIGACFNNFSDGEAMVWTFNTTNDTYTTTNGTTVNAHPDWYGLISVTLNGTDITSQLTAQ